MALVISNFLNDKFMKAYSGETAFTTPPAYYLALYTSDPTQADVGTEVTGGSYARQPITWNALASHLLTNTATITFPLATANWGTIGWIAIRDAVTAGNLHASVALTTPITINSGSPQLVISAGNLTFSDLG